MRTWTGSRCTPRCGCRQYVSGDHIVFLLALGNQVTWPIQIPALGALVGVSFHVQALVSAPGVNPWGGVVTNAGTAVIGG